MMRIQNIIRASVVMITLLFLSCVKSEDSFQNATVRLRLEGGIGVTIPDAAADTRAGDITPTVETLRVLTFNSSGALMGNVLLQGSELGIAADASNYWIITIPSGKFVEASYGDNHVYVVLNESVAGITGELEAETLTQTDMETIRGGKVAYNELIPVTEEGEPPFIMCVYDVVNVSQSQTTLNLTGLVDYGSPTYGFPMRRTMAKVILESIVGGVKPNGNIVGTEIQWNEDAINDQLGADDKNNEALIATSAIHIQNVELVNIPTQYSWKQEENDENTYTNYDGDYLQDPVTIASSDFHLSNKYFDRDWPGNIAGEGDVKFTRIDAMYSFFKIQSSSGKNAYAVFNPEDIAANPDQYYYWGITGASIPVPTTGISYTIPYSDAMKTTTNFSHYTIDDNGIVHLYNTSGQEFDAPNNSLYTLNKGNFISFFQENYSNMSGNFTPGRPVAGELTSRADINPAVWKLKFNPVSYYIPENITNSSPTKIRITASIAYPTVVLSDELVNNAINKEGNTGSLVGEEGKLDMSDDNIINYLYAKGNMLPHPTKVGYYALAYAGLSRMYEGTVHVTGGQGTYEGMVGSAGVSARVVTIEIPLNNEKADDHNIYRGHEYRVKLYVTKSSDAWQSANSNRSITYHQLPTMTRSGAEDLCIAAEVVTSTSAN